MLSILIVLTTIFLIILLLKKPDEDRVRVNGIDANSSMEMLPVNGQSGQSYGYIAYRKSVSVASNSAILKVQGHVHDIAMVIVDGKQRTEAPTGDDSLRGFGFWPAQ
jgi:hypothetical protein